MSALKPFMEAHQAAIYFFAVIAAAATAMVIPETEQLSAVINPALALMLFVTFLQVPLTTIGKSITQVRFIGALLIANFIVIPLLIAVLLPFLPAEPLVKLGIILVLLAPCIDYVVTFAHLGRADATRLLAATPILLMLQMLALPFYLTLFLGHEAARLIVFAPFIDAFIWLIAIPLALAALLQWLAARLRIMATCSDALGYLTVPATALVLFIVVAAVIPQLRTTWESVLLAIPFYLLFALLAPLLGWLTSRVFRLDSASGRAVAFSASTRNSLVILPLALAIPGALPLLPAVIVSQTLVELLSELIYIRVIPKLNAPEIKQKNQ
ncbi:putative membrane protein [Pectobacterium atrosepticum SCRI1043]|uniref:Membrane protein n=1 Tax=Pectobacterium atrosepticum (strain SCRI 1043 / ATCC BAA-672) TaxID=218491 RepID=Q6D4X5_PECAS|nr:arsenic resistance protein [Pectobacterium atrosepticum]AIA71076.1 arsenic resistance protein [Pectobacterium atrosepticum]AIK14099.1 putative membrane protein [Pectobacterium atrosepticum]MCL6315740.1 arsenic resistance protein [Pectobacterium atrosepticum]MCL6320024.1 arsenic resistance protein [Pectobacterium atrosepticum]POW29060.1 arsenic resistance protein [Pectobacterium atrosepticum]